MVVLQLDELIPRNDGFALAPGFWVPAAQQPDELLEMRTEIDCLDGRIADLESMVAEICGVSSFSATELRDGVSCLAKQTRDVSASVTDLGASLPEAVEALVVKHLESF